MNSDRQHSILVSVCIPAFKAEKHLQATLESVRGQSLEEWELIVTEDGSQDGTEEIVKQFAQSVSQSVRYLRHEANQGLPSTRNTCIKAAKGALIALLDSDDLWNPDHLEVLVKLIQETGADIVHSGCILFEDGSGRTLEVRAPTPEQLSKQTQSLYNISYIIQPSSAVLNRSVFERAGYFDQALRYCEDIDFWFRAIRAGCTFSYSGIQSCRYRKHPGAMSGSGAVMTASLAAVYFKHLDWDAIPRHVRLQTTSRNLGYAGRMHFRKSPTMAASFYFKAWKLLAYRLDYLALAVLSTVLGYVRNSPTDPSPEALPRAQS